jgi:formate/nitrite transporter FocA (FNT family)
VRLYNGSRSAAVNIIKILILVLLAAIVISLGTALYHLGTGKGDSKKMLRALTVRIVLSLALFLLLMIAWRFGLISPRGDFP